MVGCQLDGTEGSDNETNKKTEEARRHRAELILLDIMMSELDGLTILKFMGADGRLRQVPVIMITARDLPQTDIRLPGQNSILTEGATDSNPIPAQLPAADADRSRNLSPLAPLRIHAE